MAINSVLQTDTITVFGPPESIEVSLDIGPQGDRGSLIYSGAGDPNTNSGVFSNNPAQVSDIYIRTDLGADYGLVYQYNTIPGGEEWQSILKIQPILYNALEDIEFVSGTASVSIPLSSIYADAPVSLTASDIAVLLTPQHSQPVAHTISTKGITSGTSRSLIIVIKAKEITGSIADLTGTVKFNILISVII